MITTHKLLDTFCAMYKENLHLNGCKFKIVGMNWVPPEESGSGNADVMFPIIAYVPDKNGVVVEFHTVALPEEIFADWIV